MNILYKGLTTVYIDEENGQLSLSVYENNVQKASSIVYSMGTGGDILLIKIKLIQQLMDEGYTTEQPNGLHYFIKPIRDLELTDGDIKHQNIKFPCYVQSRPKGRNVFVYLVNGELRVFSIIHRDITETLSPELYEQLNRALTIKDTEVVHCVYSKGQKFGSNGESIYCVDIFDHDFQPFIQRKKRLSVACADSGRYKLELNTFYNVGLVTYNECETWEDIYNTYGTFKALYPKHVSYVYNAQGIYLPQHLENANQSQIFRIQQLYLESVELSVVYNKYGDSKIVDYRFRSKDRDEEFLHPSSYEDRDEEFLHPSSYEDKKDLPKLLKKLTKKWYTIYVWKEQHEKCVFSYIS